VSLALITYSVFIWLSSVFI